MSEDDDDLSKTLELAIAQLEREYGKGTIMRLGDQVTEPWPAISTGALTLDLALGIGGLPRGRIVEIYGPESSGKSTICLSLIAEAQAQGGRVAFIDAEHALDPNYARALGVNLDDMLISQPTNGEEALEIMNKLVSTGALHVIVVDSVAALTPKAEIEGTMEDNHVGKQPRLMAQALRKVAANASRTKTMIVFTNQLREKIGIMFGNPETTPGGRSLKFYASVRIDLRKKEILTNKVTGEIEGITVKAKIVKNKMAPPLKIAEFQILYARGVNQLGSLIDAAVTKGIMSRSGNGWYSYEDTKLGQGLANAIEALASDMEMTNTIRKKVLDVYGL